MLATLMTILLIQSAPSPEGARDMKAMGRSMELLGFETVRSLAEPFIECAKPRVAEHMNIPAHQRSESADGTFMLATTEACLTNEIVDRAAEAHRRIEPELTEAEARHTALSTLSLFTMAAFSPLFEGARTEAQQNPPCTGPDGRIVPCTEPVVTIPAPQAAN